MPRIRPEAPSLLLCGHREDPGRVEPGIEVLRHLCTWCGAAIRTLPTPNLERDRDGHGLCDACLPGFGRRQGTALFAQVGALPQPTLVMAGDLRIRAASQLACDLFQHPWNPLLGLWLGELLGCGHDPEVALGDPLCLGCGLHRLVRHTLQTGRSAYAALPGLDSSATCSPSDAPHRVTALRLGDTVALRFERLTPGEGVLL